MSRPYASIILPTHDRSRTLPYAIRSILAQSIQEIEVILVGDGCTEDVRNICRSFEAEDDRVKFMDLPKAPLRGGANRDLGVRNATAERIFYCDDDDLFLKDHILILGKELDHCDIVDTPAVTACPEGHVELAILNSESQTLKDFLLDEKFKGVFDTHLAHKKEAYLANAPAWLKADDDRVVLHMLKTFASDSRLKWITVNEITAISLHGIRRLTMTDKDREDELQKWSRRIERPGIAEVLRRNGRFSGHVMRLLWALRNYASGSSANFLELVGLELDRTRISNSYRSDDYFEVTEKQKGSIQSCIDLASGAKSDLDMAAILFGELIDPLLGPWFNVNHILGQYLRLYGEDEVSEILGLCKNRPATWLAAALLAIRRNSEYGSEMQYVERRFGDFPIYNRFAAGWAIVQSLQSRGMAMLAWDWSTRILPLTPYSKHAADFWHSRRRLAMTLDRSEDLFFAKEMASKCQALLK